MNRNRPGLGICFGIIERELNLEVPKIRPAKPLRHPEGVSVRMAGKIEPRLVVITSRFHHKGIAIPMSDRISHERRVSILGKNPAIREDLAIGHRVLIKNRHQAWRLDHLPRSWE